jgi:hypothetical protein
VKIALSTLVLSLTILTSSSCAHVKGAIEERYCNELGAYEKGMNDGMSGARMDNSWTSICEAEDQREFSKKYQEGFVVGFKKMPERAVIDTH